PRWRMTCFIYVKAENPPGTHFRPPEIAGPNSCLSGLNPGKKMLVPRLIFQNKNAALLGGLTARYRAGVWRGKHVSERCTCFVFNLQKLVLVCGIGSLAATPALAKQQLAGMTVVAAPA